MKYYREFKDSLEELVLSIAQRVKRRQAFKRSAPKRKAAIKRAKFKKATPEKLRKRARQLAIKTVKIKLAGGEPIANLSISQKMQIDKRAEKKKGLINKLAKKFLKVVRKKESERLRGKEGKK